jgi:hypothetical protein
MIYERAILETIENHLCKLIVFHGLKPVNIYNSLIPITHAPHVFVLETKSPINCIESLKTSLNNQFKILDNMKLGSVVYYYNFKCEVITKMNANNNLVVLEEWGIRISFRCSIPKETEVAFDAVKDNKRI